MVKWLLEVVPVESVRDLRNNTGTTPIHLAAAVGNLESLRTLISGRSELANAVDNNGANAVFYAAHDGRLPCLQFLTSAEIGGDVNRGMKNNKTPFHAAVHGGHVECVRYLVDKYGAGCLQYRTQHGATMFHFATAMNHVDVLDYLLNLPAASSLLSLCDVQGKTPAHIAADRNHLECLQLLIYHGADIFLAKRDVSVYDIAIQQGGAMRELVEKVREDEEAASAYYPEDGAVPVPGSSGGSTAAEKYVFNKKLLMVEENRKSKTVRNKLETQLKKKKWLYFTLMKVVNKPVQIESSNSGSTGSTTTMRHKDRRREKTLVKRAKSSLRPRSNNSEETYVGKIHTLDPRYRSPKRLDPNVELHAYDSSGSDYYSDEDVSQGHNPQASSIVNPEYDDYEDELTNLNWSLKITPEYESNKEEFKRNHKTIWNIKPKSDVIEEKKLFQTLRKIRASASGPSSETTSKLRELHAKTEQLLAEEGDVEDSGAAPEPGGSEDPDYGDKASQSHQQHHHKPKSARRYSADSSSKDVEPVYNNQDNWFIKERPIVAEPLVGEDREGEETPNPDESSDVEGITYSKL